MKKPGLSSVLNTVAKGDRPVTKTPKKAVEKVELKRPTYREGKINVTGYFDPSVRASFRLIQVQNPTLSLQDLLAEALNDLFKKYNVPESANLLAAPRRNGTR